MTNEEAKEVFLNRGFVNGLFDGDKWRQSIVVISKWLEQEPNIDMHSEEIKILQKRSYLEGFHEALKMSVEQEPCEDCISREAVLSLPRLITDLDISTKTLTESVDIKMIESLPSVTPKPKTDFEHKAEIVISQLRADRDRLQDAIEKIRAEIIEACGYSKDYVGTFDYTTTYLKIVLQIIDKYKEESEVSDADCN